MGAGAQAAMLAGGPGRGGINRGRGDAPLTWGEESADLVGRFEAQLLPSATGLDPEHSATLGVGGATPEVKPEAEAAGRGDVKASTGRTSWRRRISPRHRDAVRRFFDDSKEDQ